MRAVIQRVSRAAVAVDGETIAAIDAGLLILLGVGPIDDRAASTWLAGKISRLRIFADEHGRMNRSVVDCQGGLIVVSQFTLLADTQHGNRPSFTAAALPAVAEPLYRHFVSELAQLSGLSVRTGRFGADMAVDLCNDGPVTMIIDTPAGLPAPHGEKT